jgi:hypothetical protein
MKNVMRDCSFDFDRLWVEFECLNQNDINIASASDANSWQLHCCQKYRQAITTANKTTTHLLLTVLTLTQNWQMQFFEYSMSFLNNSSWVWVMSQTQKKTSLHSLYVISHHTLLFAALLFFILWRAAFYTLSSSVQILLLLYMWSKIRDTHKAHTI